MEKVFYSLDTWSSARVFTLEFIHCQMTESKLYNGYMVVNDTYALEWKTLNGLKTLIHRLAFINPRQFTLYWLQGNSWQMQQWFRVEINVPDKQVSTAVTDVRTIDRVKQAIVRANL